MHSRRVQCRSEYELPVRRKLLAFAFIQLGVDERFARLLLALGADVIVIGASNGEPIRKGG
jgi:hypothetical protein